MVVRRSRERDKDGGLARRSDLRYRACPGPAQHQVGAREESRHVIDEREDLCRRARLEVCGPGIIIVALPGLMDDVDVRHLFQQFR